MMLFLEEDGTIKSADAKVRYMSSSPYWGASDEEVTSELMSPWYVTDRVIGIMEADISSEEGQQE